MIALINLRQKYKETHEESLLMDLKRHEELCIDKFRYLITTRTARYKSFSNYEDLCQEGYEALLKAMINYDPNKGSFFWWAHKYIDTRIARAANSHSTIRYPMKVAKEQVPHKENTMPTMIEERYCPEKEYNKAEVNDVVFSSLSALNEQDRNVVKMVYGFEGDKPMSMTRICRTLKISKGAAARSLENALGVLKNGIVI